jgi:LPS-assembly lipoprotein
MRPRLGRRALLAGLGPALAGCGFAPLYAPTRAGNRGPVSDELAAVSVDVIPDRPGQLMRQALQQRLEGSGTGIARRYALQVNFGVAGDGIAVQPDSSITRLRLVGRAEWSLHAQDLDRTLLTNDRVRAVDGVNILNQQYFALDQENEFAQKRLAETLADQIVLQLAAYFRRRGTTA